MTQAQAQASAEAQNTALPEASGLVFEELQTYPLNSFIIDEAWIVILYPSAYTAQYTAATLEQKYAFARVSIITQKQRPTDGTEFKTLFDTAGAADPVLQPYLYP
jgi:hypothetical protein